MKNSNTYDVLIVGSGLGGLLSAVFLAKAGMKVCVLEKNKQIGGCLQTFAVDKKVFDSCVHYIGGLAPGGTLHQIFRYAGIMDKLRLKAFDENGFDRIVFGNEETGYPLANGEQNFVEQLCSYFPGERESLQRYISVIREVTDKFPLYHLRNGDPYEKTVVLDKELLSTIRQITDHPLLQQVLIGNNLLYAGEEGITPFYVHALVSKSYIHSAHKIIPGSSQISKLLWRELQSHGGEIFRDDEVVKLVEENGLIRYAETANGERYYAQQFISNIHPAVLLKITESPVLRSVYRQRICDLQQTQSACMLNLTLKRGTVTHRRFNIYWHRRQDSLASIRGSDFADSLAIYFSEDETHPGYAESISVLAYMPYDTLMAFHHTYNQKARPGDRGAAYDELKKLIAEKMLLILCKLLPDLYGNVSAESAATPLTFRDYTHTPQGSLYGVRKDVRTPANAMIAVRTRIPNLMLTGQNINLHGVLGVSITAISTTAALLGMDHLLHEIRKA